MRRIQASPLRSVFLFSAAEPLEEELVNGGWLPRIEDWPNVTVTRVAVRDHTLRPLMAQQRPTPRSTAPWRPSWRSLRPRGY